VFERVCIIQWVFDENKNEIRKLWCLFSRKRDMNIVLRTRDDVCVDVASEDVQLSVLLKTVLEGVDEDGMEIPLPNVSHAVLQKLLEFMRHYKTDQMRSIEKPLPMNKEFVDVVGQWYNAFIETFEGIDSLYELIKAADYMDIPPVHELACARLAYRIRGKEPNEIRKILGLTDDHE